MNFADISHHQTSVDLAAYKAAGHDRISHKATEGTGYTDPSFAVRWAEAGRLGLKRIAYHYARNQQPGAAEFDYFLAVVQAAGGLAAGDALMLDTEDVDAAGNPVPGASSEGNAFTGRAVARGHPDGLVYTGRWYAQPTRLAAAVFAPGWRRLILSHYDQTVPDSQILLPDGWTRDQLVARQFTATATVAGISGGCDYNRVLNDWIAGGDDVTAAEVWSYRVPVPTALKPYFGLDSYPADELLMGTRYLVGQALTKLVPLADDEAHVVAAVNAVTALVGASRDAVLAAIAVVASPTMTDAQIASLAGQVKLPVADVADAVRLDFARALGATS